MSDQEHRPARSAVPWRRRRFIVNPSFQYALVRLLVAVWVFNTALLGWFIYYLYAGPVFDVRHLMNEPDLRMIVKSPPQFFLLLALAAAIGLFLVVAVGLHLSHQIAGPAFRLRQSMQCVTTGDIDFRVSFRRNDYLMDLSESFNEMLGSLRENVREDVAALQAIEETLAADSIGRRKLRELREAKQQRVAAGAAAEILLDEVDEAADARSPLVTADS